MNSKSVRSVKLICAHTSTPASKWAMGSQQRN